MGNQNSGRRPGPRKPTTKDALSLWVHELPKHALTNDKSFTLIWTTMHGQQVIEQTEIEFRSFGSNIGNTSDMRIWMYGAKINKQGETANKDAGRRFIPFPIIQRVYPKLMDRVGKTRIRFICKKCDRNNLRKIFFYNGHFACRECHGLMNPTDTGSVTSILNHRTEVIKERLERYRKHYLDYLAGKRNGTITRFPKINDYINGPGRLLERINDLQERYRKLSNTSWGHGIGAWKTVSTVAPLRYHRERPVPDTAKRVRELLNEGRSPRIKPRT